MSNSPLVDVTILSPNWNWRGNHKIKKITIHHAAAVTSAAALGNSFARKERQGSANYGIGNDGQIGLYVPENKRAWTSGSPENDYQAITIEVSNSEAAGDYPVSDAAFDKMIALCVDICQRNGIKELTYTGDASGNLTMHRFFQATACPGEYLASRFPQIAETVNATLRGEAPMTQSERKEFDELKNQTAPKWDTVEAAPTWARATLQKLVDRGLLVGDENGALGLSEPTVRLLVINDRAGLYG